MKKVLKVLKIIGLIILIILSSIGSIFIIVFFSKKQKVINSNYSKKLNDLLWEKKKNEEVINNSDYDSYDNNGTSKPRKK